MSRELDFERLVEIGQTLSDQWVSTTSEGRISAIGPTPSDQFASPLAIASRPLEEANPLLAGRFALGWSHYVTLLTIGHAEDRAFYEVETVQNQTLPAFVRVRQEAKGSDRSHAVIPAKAGIHPVSSLSLYKPLIQGAYGVCSQGLDSRFRGNDEAGLSQE